MSAFFLEAAVFARSPQLVIGPAFVDPALRIEHREVPAADLLRVVAFESLRARVPGQHVTVWIEATNRVAGYRSDHQPEFGIGPGPPHDRPCRWPTPRLL